MLLLKLNLRQGPLGLQWLLDSTVQPQTWLETSLSLDGGLMQPGRGQQTLETLEESRRHSRGLTGLIALKEAEELLRWHRLELEELELELTGLGGGGHEEEEEEDDEEEDEDEERRGRRHPQGLLALARAKTTNRVTMILRNILVFLLGVMSLSRTHPLSNDRRSI